MSDLKVIISNDGSSTLYNEVLDETYHSTHGAITESMHVFIQNGLQFFGNDKSSINVLEIGMGTGLNALLSWQYANKQEITISYRTLEPFPLPNSTVSLLNFEEKMGDKSLSGGLQKIHELEWVMKHKFSLYFSFSKYQEKIENFSTQENFDIIYFDAFAPKKQPDIWDSTIFKKLFELTIPGGCLVSYCANGQFKRDLKSAGYLVETLSGPPGKKEMTRAIKLLSN